MIGQTILHYKIIEKIGEGGMGVVYKAEDIKLKRIVALKFLPPHLSASEQDKARFIQEAQAASALNHPNVCTIHDIQEHDGPEGGKQLFIVMEFVDGQTLQDRKSSVSLKQAIEIGIQIADGLAAAHEKGIVHRDIKPENIMIRKDGIAQIMDFGLAKLRASRGTRLTKEGSTVGTAGYMSPEQVQGQEVDHRSDIFSLGVVLFEMITGQLPFKGVHETALMYEIVNVDAPPMSSVKPGIDPLLDAIVFGCLEKDPNERTQSVKQVSVDLKRFKRESSRQRMSHVTSAIPVQNFEQRSERSVAEPRTWKRKLWPVVSGILLLSLIILVWKIWHSESISHPVARFGIVLPRDQSLEIINHTAIAISPDGSRIVYKASGRLYQRKIESLNPEPIPGTEEGESPFFSPDGRWLGFFTPGKLMKVPVSGGSAVAVADAQNDRGGTWAEDGTIIFTPVGRGGLFRVKADGGDVQALTIEDTLKNERTHRWPQALPDGKTVIYTVGTMSSPDYYEDATIMSVNVQTGERKLILKGASMARYVPTGHLIYSHAGTLFAVPFDLDRLEVSGSSFPAVENVSSDVTTGATHFSCGVNGTLAYIPGQSNLSNRSLALVDMNGSVSTFPTPPQSFVDPRISPDGKRVAVAIQTGKDFDIWIYDIQRNTMSRLTFDGTNRSPVWSPDGRRIAYSNNKTYMTKVGVKCKVVVIQADGSGMPEEFDLDYDRTYVSCWSHDGQTLVVTVPAPGKGWDLCVIPLNGDRKPWIFLSTKFDESFASLSPDGKWLAYISNETGMSQAYIRPFPRGDGKWQISTDLASIANWSSDGKTLYYSGPQGIMGVSIAGTLSLTAGQPQVVLKGYRGAQVESAVSYDIAPDGQHILITKAKEGEETFQQINVVLNWFDEIKKNLNSGK